MEGQILLLVALFLTGEFAELLLCALEVLVLLRLGKNLGTVVVGRLDHAKYFVVSSHMYILDDISGVLAGGLLRHHVKLLQLFWVLSAFVIYPVLRELVPVVKQGVQNFVDVFALSNLFVSLQGREHPQGSLAERFVAKLEKQEGVLIGKIVLCFR